MLLLGWLPAWIAAQEFPFRNIGTDMGLPSSECYYVHQDSKGYIWICTNAGMARYNGRSFNYFTTANGLTSNSVFKVFEDDQNRLFYTTSNSKIGYIRNDSTFIPPASAQLAGILGNGQLFINSIAVYNASHLIINTEKGAYLLDKKTLSHLELLKQPAGTQLLVEVRQNMANGSYYPDPAPVNDAFFLHINVTIQKSGKRTIVPVKIPLGTWGLSVFKPCYLRDGRIMAGFWNHIVVIGENGVEAEMPLEAKLTDIYQDPNDGVWISTLDSGLCYYPKADLKSKPFRMFRGQSPSHVFMDREGGVWVSTLNDGVFFCPNLGIVQYKNTSGINGQIFALSKVGNRILTGGNGNSIFVFSDKYHYERVVLPHITNIRNGYSYMSHGKEILVAGMSSSFVLDSNYRFVELMKMPGVRYGSHLYRLTAAAGNTVWGISYYNLLRYQDHGLSVARQLPARGKDICTDGKGRTYIATVTGLYMIRDSNMLEVHGLKGKINNLNTDTKGRLWACADGRGVFRIEGLSLADSITVTGGLPSNICYSVAFDQDRHIWIGTNKGLCRFDSLMRCFIFTTNHGLSGNEIFKLEILNRELYIATPKGLCVADLDALKPNAVPPPVYISGIYNNRKPVSGQSVFDSHECNFQFRVEGLSYQDPGDISYLYRLMGYDTSWVNSAAGDISFNNLADGSYTLQVKALNADGAGSMSPVMYSFTISPPYWKSIWFALLLLLMLAAVIYLIIRGRIEIIEVREKRKTALNKLIAEYQMSAIRAQMNPHFIFNAINSIQHYILSNETQYAYDYLARFSKLIRQVLANSRHSTISIEKELELLELYIDLEQRRFKNRFEYEIRYADSLPIEEIKIPVMLIQPFVENAIWHGIMNLENQRMGKLSIELELQGEVLRIAITDNGVGRKRAAELSSRSKHESMGMMLTQQRMELMKAMSKEDARIVITDLEENGNPTGTRVELFLPVQL